MTSKLFHIWNFYLLDRDLSYWVRVNKPVLIILSCRPIRGFNRTGIVRAGGKYFVFNPRRQDTSSVHYLNFGKVLWFIFTDTYPNFFINTVFSRLRRSFILSMCDAFAKMGIVGAPVLLIVRWSSNVIYDHMFLVFYKNLHKYFAGSVAPS